MWSILFWVIPVFMVYLYGFITVAKYDHIKRKLDLNKTKPGDSLGTGALWFLCLCIEPKDCKGLIYPTLWMWDRFREEYPPIKAQEARDRKFELEMKRKDKTRKRESKHGEVRREDAQAEVDHQIKMAVLDKETDELQKQWAEGYPPEIENKTFKEIKAAEEAMDAEWWCNAHDHWTTNRTKKESCKS